MKVLQISLSNIGGGAAKIVTDLHSELLNRGIDSELIIFEGSSSKKTIIINRSKISVLVFRLKNLIFRIIVSFFTNKSKDYRSINIFPSILLNRINSSDADIVHLHWIGAEMISIKQISQINKKIIWTLHDAWPLNGSYHINPKDYDTSIPLLDSYKPDVSGFLERKTLNRKKKYLSEKKILFTSPSNWLLKKYNSSFYNKNMTRCVVIPNFIDLSIWKPLDKKTARRELNIKTSKTLLTFGSSNAKTSFNKGFHNIKKLLKKLSPEDYGIIIFGNDNEETFLNGEFETFNFGRINSVSKMKSIYSAGDITIVPSMSESFSLVSLESIACNTPVLAFKSSGIIDIVKHKENGFLSERFNVDSLKKGVHWLTKNKPINIFKSVSHFSKSKIVNQFEDLYFKELKNI